MNIFDVYKQYLLTPYRGGNSEIRGKYSIYAAGYEWNGSMGSGNSSSIHSTPVKLPFKADMIAYRNGTLIYSVDNIVYAIGGSNSNLGLDNPDNYPIYESKVIFKGNNIKKIKANNSTLSILDGNDLWVTGSNFYGGLGTGNTEDVSTLIKTQEDVIDFIVDDACSYLIKSDGLYCCGQLADANIDIPNFTDKYSFFKFSDITDVDKLIGFSFTGIIATKTDNIYAYIFGKNNKNLFTNSAVTTVYQGSKFEDYFTSTNRIYCVNNLPETNYPLFCIVEDGTLKLRGYDKVTQSSAVTRDSWYSYKTDCSCCYSYSNSTLAYASNNDVYYIETRGNPVKAMDSSLFKAGSKILSIFYDNIFLGPGKYEPSTFCLVDDTSWV